MASPQVNPSGMPGTNLPMERSRSLNAAGRSLTSGGRILRRATSAVARDATTAQSTSISSVSVERRSAGSVVHHVCRFVLEKVDPLSGVGGVVPGWSKRNPGAGGSGVRTEDCGIEDVIVDEP